LHDLAPNEKLCVCGRLFAPLVERTKEELIQRDYAHADETTVQVLKEAEKSATSKSYRWVYLSGGSKNPILVYDYAPGRAGVYPSTFLEEFKGYLQTDA